MTSEHLINPNPIIHERKSRIPRVSRDIMHCPHCIANAAAVCEWPYVLPMLLQEALKGTTTGSREPIDAVEVFEHIRDITDPEHPYTLEQLNVVEESLITVDDASGYVE
jgi:hypothetical protein